MDGKEMIVLQNSDGKTTEVELITYLISEDNSSSYLVYSKGEKTGVDSDEVIYIARLVQDGDVLRLREILSDLEWSSVLKLLKQIANASA